MGHGALWARFTTYLRQQLASRAGIGRSELRDCLKVSYAKVAEYQRLNRLTSPRRLEAQPCCRVRQGADAGVTKR